MVFISWQGPYKHVCVEVKCILCKRFLWRNVPYGLTESARSIERCVGGLMKYIFSSRYRTSERTWFQVMSGIAKLQRQQLTIIRRTAGFNVGYVGHSKGGRPTERGKGPGSRFFRACDRVRIKHSNSCHFKNYHDVTPLTSQLYRI